MKLLTAISQEELARILDRAQQGQDLERRAPEPKENPCNLIHSRPSPANGQR